MKTVLEPILAALLVFTVVFLIIRGLEWGYHHLRHTRDWSPHWGTWLFALLGGLYALITSLGRQ